MRGCFGRVRHRVPTFSLVRSAFRADLRVPLPERAYVRSLSEDGRPARSVCEICGAGAGREAPVPGRGAFQGEGLLLDRLRARLARGAGQGRGRRRRRQGVRRRTVGGGGEEGVDAASRGAKKRAPTADEHALERLTAPTTRRPDRAPGCVRESLRRWQRRRAAHEHRDRRRVVLRADDHRLAADRLRVAAEPAVERLARCPRGSTSSRAEAAARRRDRSRAA